MFSRRSSVRRDPNRLARALTERQAAGQPLLDLTLSNPTLAGIEDACSDVLGALHDPRALRYEPDPLGLLSARLAISRDWQERGLDVPAEHIVLTASTSEAYGFLFKLLCDPGDQVLVPRPSYPLFEHLARLDGVELVQYRLAYDGAWGLDLDHLRSVRTPRARAVIVVHPNNPTGSFIRHHELDRLVELGLPIISDEVFSGYAFAESADHPTTLLEASSAFVVSLGGLSKSAALPQLKLGWMSLGGPSEPVASALGRLELIADSYLSVGSAVQWALPRLLVEQSPVRRAIRHRTAENLGSLQRRCAGTVVTPLHVEGGWTAVLRLPGVLDEEQWVIGLLQSHGVLVQPGWFYDFFEEPLVVVSLLIRRDQFDDGVSRLVEYAEAVSRSSS
jgi:alanine-synthesizing transaminase